MMKTHPNTNTTRSILRAVPKYSHATTTTSASTTSQPQPQPKPQGIRMEMGMVVQERVRERPRPQRSRKRQTTPPAATPPPPTTPTPQPVVLDSLAHMMEYVSNASYSKPLQSQQTQSQLSQSSESTEYAPGSVIEAELEFQCLDPETYHHQQQQQLEEEEEYENDYDDAEEEEEDEQRYRDFVRLLRHQRRINGVNDNDDYNNDSSNLEEENENGDDWNANDNDSESDTDRDPADIIEHHTTTTDCDRAARDSRSSRSNRRKNHTGHMISTSTPTSPRPRSFLILWTALSHWVTPQAVLYLQQLQALESSSALRPFEPVLQADSDVAVSRCAGLYAQLHGHVPMILESELYLSRNNDTRLALTRLEDLLRCFSYTRPMPDFTTSQLKALTCILLHSVLRHEREAAEAEGEGLLDEAYVLAHLPASIVALNMTVDEYRYLVTALIRFGSSSNASASAVDEQEMTSSIATHLFETTLID